MPPRNPDKHKVVSLKAQRFGKWLLTRRQELKEPLSALANRGQIGTATLSGYETGIKDPMSIDLRSVRKLAIAYRLKPVSILKQLMPELADVEV